MRKHGWKLFFGAGVLGASVLAAGATQSTAPAKLNVKLGLWEMSAKPQVTGDMSGMIDPQKLQQMSADERARVQAAMQQMQAAMQKPRVTKECMTQEKLARGFSTGNDDSNCKSTIVTNTPAEYEAHLECAAAKEGTRTMKMRITALSNDHVTGTVHSDMSHSGKTMTVDADIEGRFLSADCGSIKDSEEEPSPH